jgi:hypothetical protein
MKIKLSLNQFTTLFNIFTSTVGEDELPPADNFEARLLLAILQGIWKQLYKKRIDVKKKYSLTLSEQEALAFWIFFNKFEVLPIEAVYERTIVQMICNSIHQKFTT